MDVPAGHGSQQMHIVLTFDDGFWAPAYATMRSICLATRRRRDLVFHLFHLDLSEDHKRDLDLVAEEFGASVNHSDLGENESFQNAIGQLPATRQFPAIVYARLLLDRLLPKDMGRAVYIDCDMMVRSPIELLWTTDLDGKALGAVADPWGAFFSIGRDYKENRDLYDPADPYFNSGLMLIDLGSWAQADLLSTIKSLEGDGVMDRLYYDQGILNIAFRDQVRLLDWRWNVTSPKPAHERLGAHVFHYSGHHKPWKLFANVGFFRMYRHVMTNKIFYKFLRYRVRRRIARLFPFLKADK